MKRVICWILPLMLLLSGCGTLVEKLLPEDLLWGKEEQTSQDPLSNGGDFFADFTFPFASKDSVTEQTQAPAAEQTEPVEITEAVETKRTLPLQEDSVQLTFYSGVGNWATTMTLCRDGSFYGEFYDLDMGDSEDAYPNGTMWYCSFRGAFKDCAQDGEYAWSVKLDYLETANEEWETWIEEGYRFVATTPYGLEESEEFMLYLPGMAANELPEDVVSWWGCHHYGDETPKQLDRYALRNMNTDYTFFSGN